MAGIDTDNNQLKVAAEAAVEEILMAMATAMTMTTAMMTAAMPTTTWKGSCQMTLLVE